MLFIIFHQMLIVIIIFFLIKVKNLFKITRKNLNIVFSFSVLCQK